jgi:hypothetical protein
MGVLHPRGVASSWVLHFHGVASRVYPYFLGTLALRVSLFSPVSSARSLPLRSREISLPPPCLLHYPHILAVSAESSASLKRQAAKSFGQ